MSYARDLSLSHDEIDLKIATDDAVDAAGGQARLEPVLEAKQSHISNLCSRTTRAFARIDQVAKIEDRGIGRPGHPHITRALARRQGFVLVPAGDAGDEASLPMHLGCIASEAGDVIKLLAARVADSKPMSPREIEDALRETDELADAVAGLRASLTARRPAPPG
jgi:hypothetical protein